MERVKTGVPGLDEMSGGGLVANRPYILVEPPGAGKTIMGMQFLMEGVKNREKGLYISLEESTNELEENMSLFGWNLKSIKILDTSHEIGADKWLIKANTIVSKPEFSLVNLMRVMREKMQVYKPKRIVVDSLTSVKMLYEREYDMRRGLLTLMNFLFKSKTTSLLISTTPSKNMMEEALASGIIKLHMIESKGEILNAISISKLRGSNFDKHIRPMRITDEGIVVFSGETIFE